MICYDEYVENLEKIANLIRFYSLEMTSIAGSGHLTSSYSATDLMTTLFFGGFLRYDVNNPDFPNNDRIIFSKGHATPLFYSLWKVAGGITENELYSYRKFDSKLEGHPTTEFKYTEAPTGSLGQGLSIGVGEALAAKFDKLSYKTYVLLGDGEMAEGSVWEAIQLASFYKLNNLVAIIDVNRLGQSGETMLSWDVKEYKKRFQSFGWETVIVDGHNFKEISEAFSYTHSVNNSPVAIIARTIKGKGIKEWENKNGFHAKTIPYEKIGEIVEGIGEIDKKIIGKILTPRALKQDNYTVKQSNYFSVAEYKIGEEVSTRKAYGETLLALAASYPTLLALDGEVSNSTYSEILKEKMPDKFIEMFIAEQNMVGVALGLERRGKIPFVSTFAAFFSRAFDQIRMSSYANPNIKFVGSHAGVSIGPDGASQMGIEDIAMFRSVEDCVILYPSDGVSSQKLTEEAAQYKGMVYIRTTRMELPVIYGKEEFFSIGGSNVLKENLNDKVLIIGAGITVHEALKAFEKLKEEDIDVAVIDLYSVKPLDEKTVREYAERIGKVLVVEDHRLEGGIFDSVNSSLSDLRVPVYSLSIRKKPKSGKPEELMSFEEIDSVSIVKKVKELII